MRAIWKGAVSFGLVTIPIKLFAATEQHDVSLRQVHAEDGGRVRYKRFCEVDGEEVPYSEVAKGYELPDGQVVVLTDEDMEKLPIASSRSIEVQRFVPSDQIDGIYLSKSYYLQADGPGGKPYVLLRDALGKAGTVALVKVALRQREALAVLRPFGDVLLLQTMLWPDEVRDATEAAPPDDITTRSQELQMAESYIETLTGDFDPDEFTDDYATALREVVEAKIEGHEVEQPATAEDEGGAVIDLMAALEASVAEAKRSRAERDAGGAKTGASGTRDTGSTAKKAAAKAPAKATKSSSGTAKKTAKKAEGTKSQPAETASKTAKKAPAKTAKKAPAKSSARRSA